MPALFKALVSPVKLILLALLMGTASYVSAQAAAPASAASSPAAAAAQQGLSESVLRQAQGPYRMIMNSPTVVRPKATAAAALPVPTAARGPEPVAATAPPQRRTGAATSEGSAAAPESAPVTARSAAASPSSAPEVSAAAPASATAAPVNSPTLSPVTPAQAATPAVNAVVVPVAAPLAAPVPQAPPQPALAVVAERPLIAVRQEEPLLAGPLARERPTGVVQVGFNVNANGSTSDVSVVSSTNRKLNSAVLAAVGKWVYQPLEAVRRVEVAIEFKND